MVTLVTGGTGFVGRSIVRELRARGHQVRLLARDVRSRRVIDFAAANTAELREGNVADPSSLKDACKKVDCIVHLVGIISEAGRQTFESVHTEGTRNILTAAAGAGVRRFIHMSALGTRPNAVARYHKSKWAAEELVRASKLDWTIFRPSIIYGRDDGFVNLFARISRFSPVVPLIGNGEMRFAPIPVEAVAAAFASAPANLSCVGQTFDLCAQEILTLEEVIDCILQVTRRRRLKIGMPLSLMRMQARLLEILFNLLGKAPPLNRDQLLMLQEDNVGNAQPAMDQFGLEFPPFAEGIRRYLV
ncbi:MAG TPA: complex I NDUFA9 subunit family protein [Verrucomicrobiae bacterium]|nr:complex I NDUFA9 subunit family protein [Verrucomicrobiae bacterium]